MSGKHEAPEQEAEQLKLCLKCGAKGPEPITEEDRIRLSKDELEKKEVEQREAALVKCSVCKGTYCSTPCFTMHQSPGALRQQPKRKASK